MNACDSCGVTPCAQCGNPQGLWRVLFDLVLCDRCEMALIEKAFERKVKNEQEEN